VAQFSTGILAHFSISIYILYVHNISFSWIWAKNRFFFET